MAVPRSNYSRNAPKCVVLDECRLLVVAGHARDRAEERVRACVLGQQAVIRPNAFRPKRGVIVGVPGEQPATTSRVPDLNRITVGIVVGCSADLEAVIVDPFFGFR